MQQVDLILWDGEQVLWSGVADTPLEIGRQQEGDSGLLEVQNLGGYYRLVIAPLSARTIPRQALRVEAPGGDLVQLRNIHSRLAFYVGAESTPLPPGESFEGREEVIVSLPEGRTLKISPHAEDSAAIAEAESQTFRTMAGSVDSTFQHVAPARLGELFEREGDEDRGRVAVDLVRRALTVVRQSAGSNEFYDSAVRSAAEMIELDRALILLRENGEWHVRSSYTSDSDSTAGERGNRKGRAAPSGSTKLLNRVLLTGKTVIYEPSNYMHTTGSSMMALDRAVAAPIIDEKGSVIGALYGDRKFGSALDEAPIGELEAALLEVMAGAVSSGLARQRQEQLRASLTQFFSPAVTERLEKNDDLLAGRDVEVSVLFCDIRGFSTISERVGPQRTIEWINDVLTELSQCVMQTDGVLVDYVGDEVMAMWGAPGDQPDHAERACQAACEMLRRREAIHQRWHEITPERFGFGIGINTGIARVGNTGSKVKFKYGPLGNTVNLASRVQGVTKKLGVAALITESTARAIGDRFDHRRLSTVRTVGITEPVVLHELKADADDQWREMSRRYESALQSFDASDLTSAARELASLVHDHPEDSPSVVLLGRVVDAIMQRAETVNPVLVLDSK